MNPSPVTNHFNLRLGFSNHPKQYKMVEILHPFKNVLSAQIESKSVSDDGERRVSQIPRAAWQSLRTMSDKVSVACKTAGL
jgi:hypothetical protein